MKTISQILALAVCGLLLSCTAVRYTARDSCPFVPKHAGHPNLVALLTSTAVQRPIRDQGRLTGYYEHGVIKAYRCNLGHAFTKTDWPGGRWVFEPATQLLPPLP